MLLPRDIIGVAYKGLNFNDIDQDRLRFFRSLYLSMLGLGWVCSAGAFVAILMIMPPFMQPSARALIIGGMPLAGIALLITLGGASPPTGSSKLGLPPAFFLIWQCGCPQLKFGHFSDLPC
ncbi:MAG: hypothetical protein ACI92Z_002539 [Paracoccaceae bacterium]|jgi:hypothetical protein